MKAIIDAISAGNLGSALWLFFIAIVGYGIINAMKSYAAKIPELLSRAKDRESEDAIIAKLKADQFAGYDTALKHNSEEHGTLFTRIDEVRSEVTLLDKAYSERYTRLETLWEQNEKVLATLSSQIEKVESRVESRIDRLEQQLNGRFETLSQAITEALSNKRISTARKKA